ncbi:MAG: apolipoprotein N-acyltransferase [Gammaproteobacteria bacterium]|nr:apolipoprotein N-acyltransferase [Gammaproteobacteria bacterium]
MTLNKLWNKLSWFNRPSGRLVYLFALFLGAIYPLGLAPLSWWPLLFLSVFGLAWLLLNVEKQLFWKVTYCYGVGFFAVGASWVHVSIHQFGNAPLWLSISFTAIFVLFLALFKALVGLLLSLSARYLRTPIIAFPLFWLAADYVQGNFLTGFPWLYLGYGLIDSPFSSWLPYIGVSGVSLLSVVIVTTVALIVFRLLRSEQDKTVRISSAYTAFALISLISALTAFSGLSGNNAIRSQSASIAIVQPNIPQAEKWNPDRLPEYLNLYDRMTEPLWGAEFIIWPEAAIPALQHRVENWLKHWESKAIQANSELILGIPRYDFNKQRVYASLASYGAQSYLYDKHHLVPFGEFVPYEGLLRGLIEFFNLPMSRMAPGKAVQSSFSYEKLNFLPAICYEIAYVDRFLNANKSKEKQAVNVILTVSNDAWFGRSWGPHQHYQIARARARELSMPLIRATNNGISAVVDAKGNTLKQLPHYEASSFVNTFEFNEYDSLYLKHNNFIVILLILAAQLFLFLCERILSKNP